MRLILWTLAAVAWAQGPDWLDNQFLKIHMELNVPHRPAPVGDRFDDEKFRQAIRDSRVQVVVLFAKDAYGNAFFQTKHDNFEPGLKFDLVKRQLGLLHQMGLKVVVHYSVGDDSRIDLFHSEWLCRDLNGKPLVGGPLSNRACLNSRYREELLLPQLEELTRLGVDGLWLDIFRTPQDCFCASCQKKFRARYGGDLSPSDPRRSVFWSDSADEALAEINRRTRAINPNLAITFNGAHLLRHARSRLVDFFTVESHVSPATGYEVHHMQARYLRALGLPFDIQYMTNVERWDDSTLKWPAQLEVELSEILASGGRVSAGTQLYPWGEYEEAGARVLGEAYGFARKRLPFLDSGRTRRHLAVLAPDVSPGTGSWRIGSDTSLVGLVMALTQMQIQFDILDGSNAGYDLLPSYEVAILPAPALTLDQTGGRDAVSRFLKSGRKVLLISDGSDRLPQVDAVLGFAVRATRSHVKRGALSGGAVRDFPFSGDLITFESPSAQPMLNLRDNSRSLAAGGLLSKQVAWVGWPFGRIYYETGYPEWRKLLGEVLSALDLQPPFSIQAPASVIANLMERPGELLLHLVNVVAAEPLPGLMPTIRDTAPVYHIPVAIRCSRPSEIMLEPEGRKLEFTYDGQMAHFQIPEINIYEIARIVLPR